MLFRRFGSALPLVVTSLVLCGCPDCGFQRTPTLLFPIYTSDEAPTYLVIGDWHFSGILEHKAVGDGNWILEGGFVFATSGYDVSEPEVEISESLPERVRVRITVTPPPPGRPNLQVITRVPVLVEIPASNKASFDLRIITACDESLSSGVFEGAPDF